VTALQQHGLALRCAAGELADVAEHRGGCLDGAVNIPLSELRWRLDELPRNREIWVNCNVGLRSYIDCRMREQNGFRTRILSGGFHTYRSLHPEQHEHVPCTV
jgi:rhodanese-related sulfurtransferase